LWQVLFAFMVGIHNLYWYYGSQTYELVEDGAVDSRLVHSSEAFRGSVTYAACSCNIASYVLITVCSITRQPLRVNDAVK